MNNKGIATFIFLGKFPIIVMSGLIKTVEEQSHVKVDCKPGGVAGLISHL